MAKYCPKCGTENLNDAKFCKKCGKNLEEMKATTSINKKVKTMKLTHPKTREEWFKFCTDIKNASADDFPDVDPVMLEKIKDLAKRATNVWLYFSLIFASIILMFLFGGFLGIALLFVSIVAIAYYFNVTLKKDILQLCESSGLLEKEK